MPATRTVRISLHRKQREFRESAALYRGFVGGRGSGKSWVGGYDLIRRAKPGRTYLVGSPTGVLMQDTTFPTFQKLARELCFFKSVKLTPYPNVTLGNGAVVRFRTAEDPDRMRGPNITGVWLDEASLMGEAAYDVCIASLREGGEQGWLSATFTPKGLTHWTHEVFNTGRADVALVRARTADNPFVPREFEGTLARQYGPSRFARQELYGEFVSTEGAEWPAEYFDKVLVPPPEWPRDLVHRAAWYDGAGEPKPGKGDFHALALLGFTRDGTLWFDADLWHSTAGEACERIDRLCRPFQPRVVGVETNFGQGFVLSHYRLWLELANLKRPDAQFRPPLPWKGYHVKDPKPDRIRLIDPYLARGQVRVRDTPGGRLLVAQWRDWPHADHDDGPDAAAGAVWLASQVPVQVAG